MTNYRDKMSAIEKTVDAVLGRGIDFLIDGEDKIRPVILLVRDHIPDVSRDELKFVLRNSLAIRKGWPNKKSGNSRLVEVPELPPVTGYSGSSVGEAVCRLLLANSSLSNGKIAEIVRDKIPGAKTTDAAVACYRTALVASEKLRSPRSLPPVGSLICKLLLENSARPNSEIAAEVRKRLGSRTTANNIANYRNYLRCAAKTEKGNSDEPENHGVQKADEMNRTKARDRAEQCEISVAATMCYAKITWQGNNPNWWFDLLVVKTEREGNITLLLYDHRIDKLHYLQVPTSHFRKNRSQLYEGETAQGRPIFRVHLSTDKGDWLCDIFGEGKISFAQFHRGKC